MVEQACRSFALQTYRPMELIIVNDGEPLHSKQQNVRVVQVPRGTSIGAKRNTGVRAALGDYVATWDDDDFSLPERIATQVAAITAAGTRYHRYRSMWIADEKLSVAGILREYACYPTSLVHRVTLLEVGGYPDISYLEDMELFIRFTIRGIKVSNMPSGEPATYVHRRHGTNVSRFHESNDEHFKNADTTNPAAIAHVNGRIAAMMAVPFEPFLVPA